MPPFFHSYNCHMVCVPRHIEIVFKIPFFRTKVAYFKMAQKLKLMWVYLLELLHFDADPKREPIWVKFDVSTSLEELIQSANKKFSGQACRIWSERAACVVWTTTYGARSSSALDQVHEPCRVLVVGCFRSCCRSLGVNQHAFRR